MTVPNCPDEQLDRILADYEARTDHFYEVAIVDAIRNLRQKLNREDDELGSRLQAESMAFSFCEDYPDETTGWGTYYGPLGVFPNQAGRMVESPSIQCVTVEMLAYWAKRADEAKHPKLRARYADLLWDFSKRITGATADVRFARMVIDANLEIAAGDDCEHAPEARTKLSRALSIALSIKDSRCVERVRDVVLAYEQRSANDDSYGSWGFAFEALIDNKKVPLKVEQEKTIIGGLEQRLERASGGADPKEIDPHAAEAAAMRLKQYYQKRNRTKEVHRVLRLFGRAHEHWAQQAEPLLGATWLKKVYEVYHENGMTADANAIAVMLREMNERSGDSLNTLSEEVSIPRQEVDAYLSALTEGTLEEALNRIAVHFVPSLENAQAQLKKIASVSTFSMYITRQIQDNHGRVVAEVGPLAADPGGHLILQLSQNIQIMNVFLRMAMDATMSKKDTTAEALAEYIFASPLFDSGDQPLVRAGVKAYLAGDSTTAVHVLIPRIEAALRNLVKFNRGSVYRPDRRRGGLLLRNLDDLLRDERVVACLTQDVTRYMQVLLTDPRGLNIRNNVCHGMTSAESFTPAMADRVLHILLVLSLVRPKAKR